MQNARMAAPTLGPLTSDNPEAYIPRDRRRALSESRALPDRVTGSALFADISGFTPLTEALRNELGPQRGSEELTAIIGRVFHEVIGELDAFGGDVIYFSGDAITCWIDGDDGTRACAAALAMQQAIARSGEIATPAGTEVRLAMKVAIAVGKARRFLVGDPQIQLIDVLAGSLVDDLAAAEHFAEKGEVVLESAAMAALAGRVTLGELRRDSDSELTYGVLASLDVDVSRTPVVEPPPLPEELVRPWLLPAVYERIRTGRGEFLTELRPAIPVFLRFGGIDYDDDPEAAARLDEFVRGAQRVMQGYGGNVLQLTLGDKGAYLYGVFGSPIAHEDDPARAAAAALELRDLEKTTSAEDLQIGLTQGTLRSGTYGHAMRRTFVCLGDEVNLSARLMSRAPAHHIYATEQIEQAAGDGFIWQRLPDMTVKGKSEPVRVYSLTGSLGRASRRRTRFELPLVGRRQELAALDAGFRAAGTGQGRLIGISAEAGLGKSRLLAEFIRNTRRGGSFVAYGECEAFGTKSAYFVWREVWRRLLGLEDDNPEPVQIAALERSLAVVDPGLVPRAPLLGPVVGLTIPETDLTRSLDAKFRKSSVEDMLSACLRARAAERPFVVVLEDCHWIDELSRDLLQVLARVATALPVLFIAAYRPAVGAGGGLGIEQLSTFSELSLSLLPLEDIAEITRAKVAQLGGESADVSQALVDLLAARSEGNPFYVEELLSYVVAQGTDMSDPEALAAVKLPESLESLVLSRIDASAEAPRRTMKVASVIGRTFLAPMLPGVYEELGTLDVVLDHLASLRTLDLVALDREAEQAWMFKHAVTRDVAYESLPFALRSVLHGLVGSYIERTEADDLDRWIPLLEHHYWRSDQEDKKRRYLQLAAEQARSSYANGAAIVYYDRLLPLLDGAERVDAAVAMADVLHLIGEIPRAEEVVLEARTVASELGDPALIARCDHSLAESVRRVGRYDEALDLLAQATEGFRSVGDDLGVAAALQIVGTVNAQRGDLETARSRYLESLEIRERLDDRPGLAALANNLGIVALHTGDVSGAREFGERALTLYEELGDQRRICQCHVNLALAFAAAGDLDAALEHSEAAVRLAREVGDRLNIALAQNNRGDALRDGGRLDAAGAAYADALVAYRELNDQWPMVALFGDIATLAARRGQGGEAFTLVGAADALAADLGASRSESDEERLMADLETCRNALGEPMASEARAAGRRLGLDAAVDLALTIAKHGSP
jgi:class 3 adenylate cyclase/tetratricopeptide (TPR) repeat protein